MVDNSIFHSIAAQEAEPFSVMLQVETGNEIITYLGFARPGTVSENENTFRIVRTLEDKTTGKITRMYAEGSRERKFAFSEAENLNYFFLK